MDPKYSNEIDKIFAGVSDATARAAKAKREAAAATLEFKNQFDQLSRRVIGPALEEFAAKLSDKPITGTSSCHEGSGAANERGSEASFYFIRGRETVAVLEIKCDEQVQKVKVLRTFVPTSTRTTESKSLDAIDTDYLHTLLLSQLRLATSSR